MKINEYILFWVKDYIVWVVVMLFVLFSGKLGEGIVIFVLVVEEFCEWRMGVLNV